MKGTQTLKLFDFVSRCVTYNLAYESRSKILELYESAVNEILNDETIVSSKNASMKGEEEKFEVGSCKAIDKFDPNEIIQAKLEEEQLNHQINKELGLEPQAGDLDTSRNEGELEEYYLPPKQCEQELTLVLDLDETLVHYVEDSEKAFIQVRPGAEEFLEEMAMFYEIIIFTAALKDVRILIIHNSTLT